MARGRPSSKSPKTQGRLTKKHNHMIENDVTIKVNESDVMKQIPVRLVSCLMPFQREGVLFAVRKGGRCLIADEMGLGKTLQAIAVACYFKSEWPVLIIVPSSLRYVWIEELEKWLPDILPDQINLIQGSFDTGGIADAKITIVTYGLLSCKSSGAVKEALKAQQFKMTICDESHYFKNSRTECCKAVYPLVTSATRCLLLSGTPALARPAELFTQLDAVLPGKFGSFWSFTKRYCNARWEHFGRRRLWRAEGASNLDELQQRLKNMMIRREKNRVLTQLPPKQRQKILFALKDSKTKKEILSTFEELKPLLKKSKSSLATNLLGGDNQGPDGVHEAEQNDFCILSRIQRLYSLTGEAKIGPAREYIQMLCENANLKFLVFAYHHSMMNGLQQTLWDKKIKFVRIDGETRPSDRQLYVQQFQSDKNTRVAILSILAAGVGLTLTAASLVVFAELYWTPGVMIQCEDRAHRIGQTSTVPIHYLVARETMDEWVWSAVCRKTLVTSTALTGKRQTLQADAGESYQVDLLSAAEAYTPADNSDIDISKLIQSQKPTDQRSILDFFSSQNASSQSSQTSAVSASVNSSGQYTDDDLMEEEDVMISTTTSTPCSKNKKTPFSIFTLLKKQSESTSKHEVPDESVIIDSSEDELNNNSQNSVRAESVTPLKIETNTSNTKTVTQPEVQTSRKRKRVVNIKYDSESDFEEISCDFIQSAKKKKKSTSVSKSSASVLKTPRITSKKSVCGESGSQALETRNRVDMESGDSKHWSCSTCTFSNSTLLPFCEMCETPLKQKTHLEAQNSTVPAKQTETVDSPVHLSVTQNFELSSPVCSSTQISKQKPQGKLVQQIVMEPACQEGDGKNTSSSPSRHRVKRNLMFDVDKLGVENVKRGKQNSEVCVFRSPIEGDGINERREFVDGHRNTLEVSEVSDTKVSELVSFQLNSSFEKDDECNSLCLFESEDEEESTLLVSEERNEHISSFTSPDSAHDHSSRGDQDIGRSRKSRCVESQIARQSFENSFRLDSDNELISEHEVDTNDDQNENKNLVKVKPPKRKSFMLAPFENDSVEISPLKHSVNVLDSSAVNALRCAVDITDLTLNQTAEEICTRKRTDSNNDQGTLSSEDPNCAEKSELTPSKPSCGEGKSTSFPETNERMKESVVLKEETLLSNQSLNRTRGSRMAEECSTALSEERENDVCEDMSSTSQCDIQQPVHSSFMFMCSAFTGRVYLFDMNGQPLNANFLPLDVELDNVCQLPDILHHPQHLRLAQHFVRQWNSLTDTKRRLISKRGLKFRNPLAAYDVVRTDLANNKQRYHTKEDQTKAATKKAQEVNGSVRVLSKHRPPAEVSATLPDDKVTAADNASTSHDTTQNGPQGYVQAMSSDGTPLCLHCQQPCKSLLSREMSVSDDTAWHTRFCSRVCADAFWMKTNTAYLRSSMYDVQHGVCQLCNFDAHNFFCQIRDNVDRKQRAEKINNSKFSKLGAGQKKQMIARPYEGQFWHVDHIRPVWEGGGQCDIDNLRTLCAPCHLSVTSKQAAKRAHARKLSKAACSADITAFFKKT